MNEPPEMAQDLFDYPKMVETALRGVMREALARTAREGLPGDHHFYVTFRTRIRGCRGAAGRGGRSPRADPAARAGNTGRTGASGGGGRHSRQVPQALGGSLAAARLTRARKG